MHEIQTYLNKPAALQLYSEGLVLFQKYAMLSHAHLWTALSAGPFGNNKGILEQTLRGILITKAPTPVAPVALTVATAPDVPTQFVKTNLQVDVLLELRHLRQKRMKTSQRFHDCDSDEERAMICDVIDAVNKDIKQIEGKLAYVQRYERLPEKKNRNFIELPDTEEELKKELMRLRSSIRKVGMRIEYLLSLPENNRKRKDIPEREKKLQDLSARLLAAKAKIKELKKENNGKGNV